MLRPDHSWLRLLTTPKTPDLDAVYAEVSGIEIKLVRKPFVCFTHF
jgi:hypothetical protein